MKSFLQTTEWLEFQKSLGRPTWRYESGGITANIIRHDVGYGKNYLYIPHGPEILFDEISGGIRNELQKFIAYIKGLAHEQKSFYIKIEPLDDKVPEMLHQFGFKKSKKELQPKRTVVLDTTKTEEELLAAMHHKTRYNINLSEKKGLKLVGDKQDVDAFWKLLKQTSAHDNFGTHPKSHYEKLVSQLSSNTATVFVEYEGKFIAGAIILRHGDQAYYLHGAMDRDPKYKPLMAPYFLHWEIIKGGKQWGVASYDFWGIDAKKYPGVTRFKLGWGGREIHYPGSFDLPISKFWYYTYKLIRRR